jgi:hypothetical protein
MTRPVAPLTRRDVLRAAAVATAGCWLPQRCAGGAAAGMPPLHGVLHNEDCTNFFYFAEFTPQTDTGAAIDRYVDVLAEAGICVLLCNTNARRTNYRSRVWQAFWDGLDPRGPDDQPFLRPVPRERVQRYRRLLENMQLVSAQGVDYPARMAARCRVRGIAPWISLRMNDVHENAIPDHPFHGRLWREHAEWCRRNDPGYFARGLDYAHREVRDYYRALIVETLERYDIDGLELDFMREPYVFSRGEEQAGRPVLSAWLTEIRGLVNAAARRRGRAIRLGVRVPSQPETALALGLDAPAWAQAGLVDLVTVAPRWRTLQYDLPLVRWRELLAAPAVALAGGLDVNLSSHPGVPAKLVTPEHAQGAAAAVLGQGADAVYLFNYFQNGHPRWPHDTYVKTLKRLGAREALAGVSRWHAVTFRDVLAPGESYRAPLPAEGRSLSFTIHNGLAPAAEGRVSVVLGVAPRTGVKPVLPQVAANGQTGRLASRQPGDKGTEQLVFDVPPAAWQGKTNGTITVTADTPVRVTQVELHLDPRGAGSTAIASQESNAARPTSGRPARGEIASASHDITFPSTNKRRARFLA